MLVGGDKSSPSWSSLSGYWSLASQIDNYFQFLGLHLRALSPMGGFHCVDQGGSAYYVGNTFRVLSSRLLGRSKKDSVEPLWQMIRGWYRDCTLGPLQRLVVLMRHKTDSLPALRHSAAQCRAVIHCSRILCLQLLAMGNPSEKKLVVAGEHTMRCYEVRSSDVLGSGASFAHHSVHVAEDVCGPLRCS